MPTTSKKVRKSTTELVKLYKVAGDPPDSMEDEKAADWFRMFTGDDFSKLKDKDKKDAWSAAVKDYEKALEFAEDD